MESQAFIIISCQEQRTEGEQGPPSTAWSSCPQSQATDPTENLFLPLGTISATANLRSQARLAGLDTAIISIPNVPGKTKTGAPCIAEPSFEKWLFQTKAVVGLRLDGISYRPQPAIIVGQHQIPSLGRISGEIQWRQTIPAKQIERVGYHNWRLNFSYGIFLYSLAVRVYRQAHLRTYHPSPCKIPPPTW